MFHAFCYLWNVPLPCWILRDGAQFQEQLGAGDDRSHHRAGQHDHGTATGNLESTVEEVLRTIFTCNYIVFLNTYIYSFLNVLNFCKRHTHIYIYII